MSWGLSNNYLLSYVGVFVSQVGTCPQVNCNWIYYTVTQVAHRLFRTWNIDSSHFLDFFFLLLSLLTGINTVVGYSFVLFFLCPFSFDVYFFDLCTKCIFMFFCCGGIIDKCKCKIFKVYVMTVGRNVNWFNSCGRQ